MNFSKIENKDQYKNYCKKHLELGQLLGSGKGNDVMDNEYYILDLIIEDYHENKVSPFDGLTPVDLLKALMNENGYNGVKLSGELNVSKSIISDIINYKRGFSKDVIRKISKKFGIGEQSFFKEYELIGIEGNVA
jgi:HTH-type transcriptional regulator/antitoxin HigA